MNRNPELGNRIILLAAAAALAIAALYVPWGTYRALSVTGINGLIPFFGISVPAWLSVAIVVFCLIVTATNMLRFSSISRRTLKWLFLLGGILLPAILLYHIMDKGKAGIGGLMLISAAIIGVRHQRPSPF